MAALIMPSLANVTVCTWKPPCLSRVAGLGAVVVRSEGCLIIFCFPLVRSSGRRRSLDSWLDLFKDAIHSFFFVARDLPDEAARQAVEYLGCNFSLGDLQGVPPASPALLFVVDFKTKGIADDGGFRSDDYLLWRLKQKFRFPDNEEHELVTVHPPAAEMVYGFQSDDGECCSVCSTGFVAEGDGEVAVLRTICGHVFHGGCIARALAQHNSCPVCSASFPHPIDIRTTLLS
ncbi:PREDICTED: uncharacterized protein LOC104801550 [Tarenaya hassleriana]|uniref:uncharacterized protein LOC104801550 n=1 Tax=Tarenaya hassleriana TaxID=28532 RepID=UPI00053C43F2|nr:PREDICTED: uncharacterized protein LOC104801550 [Tarenaya hassleriana]